MPPNPKEKIDQAHLKDQIEKAKAGDRDAFGYLYTEYLTPIYRFIYFRVKNQQEAEDLTQHVFIKAWEAMNRYQEKGFSLSAWLYVIARNTIIDFWKKKKADLVDEPEKIFGHLEDPKADHHRDMEQQERRVELLKAMQKLSDDQQTILTLKFINELSNKEIEEITGKNQDAIRALQYRGIKALRQYITLENI